MYLTLSRSEINPIMDKHFGNAVFLSGLNRAGQSNIALINLMAQYMQFNSVFGAGVANLVGEIARRQDTFRKQDESIALTADRSCDVAATIFFAAIDEFGRKKTHRSMAQDTLRESIKFFNIAADQVKQLNPAAETKIAMQSVADGYCLNRATTDSDLFFGIGFHMSSELLADQEFNMLNSYLRQKHSLLVDHLERTKAYSWIAVHTTVEADHFDAALESANYALSFYTGDKTKAHAWILKGFKNFVEVQAQFMQSLLGVPLQYTNREQCGA